MKVGVAKSRRLTPEDEQILPSESAAPRTREKMVDFGHRRVIAITNLRLLTPNFCQLPACYEYHY